MIQVFSVTATSPATQSVAVATAGEFHGLDAYDDFTIDARLAGATGGALDVVLQRKIADDNWVDWLRFASVTAAAAAASFSFSTLGRGALAATQILAVAKSTDAVPVAPTLTAGACVGGHPGNSLRVVFSAGASTTVGASQTVVITAHQR